MSRFRIRLVAALLLSAAALPAVSLVAQTPADVPGELEVVRQHYARGDWQQCLDRLDKLLARPALTAYDSIAVFEMQSLVYRMMGEDYLERSYTCLQKIAAISPCLVRLPRDVWPQDLKNRWYSVVSPLGALTCKSTGPTEPQTVAVWYFDNFSVQKYLDELGSLGSALGLMFQEEFKKLGSLQVVEREKFDYIINEQKLAAGGAVDQATAIQAGKILQAHVMVFGSFTQLDRSHTMVQARAVNVETSEIIASVSAEGNPDKYFQIVKDLVQELCQALDVKLSKDDMKLIEEGGTGSYDATVAFAKGVEYEKKHDYKLAYEHFKKAFELDPGFKEAETKMNVYVHLAA